mmetsp:Transcript_7998/g.20514  ORF Transcript_7998/g.20514 Transcript_7998/m.20514 type:complete len:246 (+) Transcript_7998:123-860(+)
MADVGSPALLLLLAATRSLLATGATAACGMHHPLQATHPRHAAHATAAGGELRHHVVHPLHPAHLLQDRRVHHVRHALGEVVHLPRVGLLVPPRWLVGKEVLHAAHLLNEFAKLFVLRQKLVHVLRVHPGPFCNALKPGRLLGEELDRKIAVELRGMHGVHDGCASLEPFCRLFLALGAEETAAHPRNHVHELSKRPKFLNVGKLLVHVPKGEVSMRHLLKKLLIVVKAKLVDFVDQPVNVAHPK